MVRELMRSRAEIWRGWSGPAVPCWLCRPSDVQGVWAPSWYQEWHERNPVHKTLRALPALHVHGPCLCPGQCFLFLFLFSLKQPPAVFPSSRLVSLHSILCPPQSDLPEAIRWSPPPDPPGSNHGDEVQSSSVPSKALHDLVPDPLMFWVPDMTWDFKFSHSWDLVHDALSIQNTAPSSSYPHHSSWMNFHPSLTSNLSQNFPRKFYTNTLSRVCPRPFLWCVWSAPRAFTNYTAV